MTERTTATPKVLIVEDEESIGYALALIVEDAGYHAIRAQHGKHAIDILQRQWPNLIMTDLMMPYMNGLELIAWLRANANQHLIPPIILMTAAGPRFTEETGADAQISKPFTIAEIEALLHRFLGNMTS